MQDRPTQDELLAAVERFLRDEVMPNIAGARAFHARVAANAIGIVRRELELEDEQLAREWAGLDALLGPAALPTSRTVLRDAIARRNAQLCDRIRGGDVSDAFVTHVTQTVRDKLLVTNPGWLGET
jgi:hypothetical protein